MGNYADRTFWTGSWEGFHYHIIPSRDGEVELLFGATGKQERVVVRAQTCTTDGFDYCLDITGGSHGVQRYYSRRAWDGHAAEFSQTLQPLP